MRTSDNPRLGPARRLLGEPSTRQGEERPGRRRVPVGFTTVFTVRKIRLPQSVKQAQGFRSHVMPSQITAIVKSAFRKYPITGWRKRRGWALYNTNSGLSRRTRSVASRLRSSCCERSNFAVKFRIIYLELEIEDQYREIVFLCPTTDLRGGDDLESQHLGLPRMA